MFRKPHYACAQGIDGFIDRRKRNLNAGLCDPGYLPENPCPHRPLSPFTVPLCRGHHRQPHQAGNEVTWWEGLNINALPIAKRLREQTHPKSVAVDAHQPNEDAIKKPA